MKLNDVQIYEIAQNLECGLKCYIHIKTGEIESIIDFDVNYGVDEDLWEDVINKINDNIDDYYEFVAPNSNDSFRLMESFINEVADKQLQDKLLRALIKAKPFRNFKWEIDNSGKYRQIWFDFKQNFYIEWVKKQLKAI